MVLVRFAHRHVLALAALALSACGGRAPASVQPAPSAPEETVTQFLAASNAADLDRMGSLWGDERGPADYPVEEKRRRLQIMQRLLVSDQHRVVGAADDASGAGRVLQVEMAQGTRRFTVPFTLVRARTGGWLIVGIDLQAAMPAPNQPRP